MWGGTNTFRDGFAIFPEFFNLQSQFSQAFSFSVIALDFKFLERAELI